MADQDGLRELVRQALADPELLRAALADPEGTLAARGIRLSGEELSAVRSFAARMGGRGPDEVTAELSAALGDRAAFM